MTPPSPNLENPLRMSYRVGRGEQSVLTFEPYKSALLPLWRFRTVELARKSAQELWERFEEYDRRDDFVGMDMCRKFVQMVRWSAFPFRIREETLLLVVGGGD
jgi:Domain of unknown function (DUF4385)